MKPKCIAKDIDEKVKLKGINGEINVDICTTYGSSANSYSVYNKNRPVQFIRMNVELDERGLLEKTVRLHEIGHILNDDKHRHNYPKMNIANLRLWHEKEAWKYVVKKLGKSRLLGHIIAGSYLTYLLKAGKIKNYSKWIHKLEYYETFSRKSTKIILNYWRIKYIPLLLNGEARLLDGEIIRTFRWKKVK